MTAPTRAPVWCDAIGGQELSPKEGIAWTLEQIVFYVEVSPDWQADEIDVRFRLSVLEKRPDLVVIGFEAASVSGHIRFEGDPSGWLLAVAEIAGVEVFSGYIERRYEEFEVWPSASGDAPPLDEPGALGKKLAWASLKVAAWPALAPLASDAGRASFAIWEEDAGSPGQAG